MTAKYANLGLAVLHLVCDVSCLAGHITSSSAHGKVVRFVKVTVLFEVSQNPKAFCKINIAYSRFNSSSYLLNKTAYVAGLV